jgi:hypothetical protein
MHVSGAGGVDGFAGSAVQCAIISNLNRIPDNHTYVFIHALNPYGMSHISRWNKNNVDIRKNFRSAFDDQSNPVYDELTTLFNPNEQPISWKFRFGIKTLLSRVEFNQQEIVDGMTEGQTLYPEGIYYIGKNLEPELKDLLLYLHSHYDSDASINVIDVQTDGSLDNLDSVIHLSESFKENEEAYIRYKALFERTDLVKKLERLDSMEALDTSIIKDTGFLSSLSLPELPSLPNLPDFNIMSSFSLPELPDIFVAPPIEESTEVPEVTEVPTSTKFTGSFFEGVFQKFPHSMCYGYIQIFSTGSSMNTLFALHVANYYANHEENVDINHFSKKKLLRAFYPLSAEWKHNVLTKGVELFNNIVDFISIE